MVASAQADTLLGPYTIYFGRDASGAFFFVKRDDLLVIPRVFREFNATLYAISALEERSVEIVGSEDASWYEIDEADMLQGCFPCVACSDDGCCACA